MYYCQKHELNSVKLKKSEIDKHTLFMIRNLDFRCINHEKGCKKILKFTDFEDHIELCDFNNVKINEICNSQLLNKWSCSKIKILSECEFCDKTFCEECLVNS